MKRKSKKPKTIKPIKPTLKKKVYSKEDLESMSQGELQYIAKQNERRIKRLLKSYEKRGFHVEPSLYENSRMKAPKKASIKSIERLQAYTPSKIQSNKKIFMVDVIDGKLVSFKGNKAFDQMKKIQAENKYQEFFERLGTKEQRKAPKIEKYKNPIGRKQIKNDSRITGIKDSKKIPSKISIKSKGLFGNPNDVFDDPSYKMMLSSLELADQIISYAIHENPLSRVPERIMEMIRKKGKEGAYEQMMDISQIPIVSMGFTVSTKTHLQEDNMERVIAALISAKLLTESEASDIRTALGRWREGLYDVPNDLIPNSWILNIHGKNDNKKGSYSYV